jgi:hypothetical protein
MMNYQISVEELKMELEKLPSIGVVDIVYNRKKHVDELLASDQFQTNLWSDAQNSSRVDGVDEDNDGIADLTADMVLPCLITDRHPLVTSGQMKPFHQKPCTRINAACDKGGTNEIEITFRTVGRTIRWFAAVP